MLLEFTVSPLGGGESLGGEVAPIIDLVDRSGLPYRLTPMSTVVEGEWDELMDLVERCHRLARQGADRVVTRINIDDRAGASGRLEGKIASIERHLGRRLSK